MAGARDALGAVVRLRVKAPDGSARTLVRPLVAAQSYLSSFEPRAHVGLGAAREVEGIEVLWPDGQREKFSLPAGTVDREVTLRKGQGG